MRSTGGYPQSEPPSRFNPIWPGAALSIVMILMDEDAHVVMPAAEAMLMPRSPREGKGETRTLTLRQLGVHHYCCPIHAVYSPQNGTYAPLKSFGGYPYVMDGIIVVVP